MWITPCCTFSASTNTDSVQNIRSRIKFLLSLLCTIHSLYTFSFFCGDMGHFLGTGWICLTCQCMEIPIWTAINDRVFGFYCGLWKGCGFFSFYDATGQFYNNDETLQAVLCCLITTAFLQLRTLTYPLWVSYSSPDVWLRPTSKPLGVQILHTLLYLSSSFFGSTCKLCQGTKSKSNYSCHIVLISLCPKTIWGTNRNVDSSNW